MAAVAQNAHVYLWVRSVGEWRTLTAPTPETRLYTIALNPDENLFATGSLSGELWVWDRATGTAQVTCAGVKDTIVDLQFSDDGKTLATLGWDSTLWIWGVP